MDALELLDFRSISREHPTCTLIYMAEGGNENLWIVTRQAHIQQNRRSSGTVKIFSRLVDMATDQEHDSCYTFSFPVIGLRFISCAYGITKFEAYIEPGMARKDSFHHNFNVPPLGYDPLQDTEMCQRCEDPHPVGANYLPDHNSELYDQVEGCKIIIKVGVPKDHTEHVLSRVANRD